jgi:hypothetical protein
VRLTVFAFLCFLSVALKAQTKQLAPACKTRKDIIDTCRVVHGRLMAYNGTPTFRIWITGTNHLLGVHETFNTQDPLMPPMLEVMANGDEFEIFGDFEVCPLSKPKKEAMQFVCIESAKHLTKRPYRNP